MWEFCGSLRSAFPQEQSRLQNLLGTYLSELSSRMIPGRAVILKGEPKNALVGKAEDLHADMMIMGRSVLLHHS